MLGTAIIRCEYTPEVSNILSMLSVNYIFPGNCVGAFFGHAYVKVREHVLLQNKITDRNISRYAQLVTQIRCTGISIVTFYSIKQSRPRQSFSNIRCI